MIESLSSTFGDNKSFATFERFPGWPTNDSIIYDRPLIQLDGKFYCFVPQVMFRKIGDILEGWIQQKDDDYYQNAYTKNRARYLENKALEYLSSILPQAEVYGKLFYWVDENGERKRVETDGLILYDENLFIIEAKAGSVSASARRGGLERIKRDSKELIDKAYEQALRTKKFIMETPEPAFQYEDGSEAVVIKVKTKYINIYLLNVTLESLGHLSTQLNSLKSLNLIHGKEWPWSVFINDLRVISELIEFPSEFLLFLQRRIRANDYPQFQALDELDFLMYYFREGLYFKDGALNGMDRFTLFAYTEDLDRYYDFLGGKASTGEKPKLRIAEEYKDLIREIEATGKGRFTRVATTLLNFDWKVQSKILDHLKSLGAASVREGRDHDFTLQFKEENLGITFSTSAGRTDYSLKKIESYCHLKMYETRVEEWILITVDFHGDGTRDIDFQVFNKGWEYHPIMEEQLKKFKA